MWPSACIFALKNGSNKNQAHAFRWMARYGRTCGLGVRKACFITVTAAVAAAAWIRHVLSGEWLNGAEENVALSLQWQQQQQHTLVSDRLLVCSCTAVALRLLVVVINGSMVRKNMWHSACRFAVMKTAGRAFRQVLIACYNVTGTASAVSVNRQATRGTGASIIKA
jgi:hypothetical protein